MRPAHAIARNAFGSHDNVDVLFASISQVLCIRQKNEPIDLFMVEIMHMRHKLDTDTRLVSFKLELHTLRELTVKKLTIFLAVLASGLWAVCGSVK